MNQDSNVKVCLSPRSPCRPHLPEIQKNEQKWAIERQSGIPVLTSDKFKFIHEEVRVPLNPQHSGNFNGYQCGQKVVERVKISALAVEPCQQRCVLAGRANGIIDVYPLHPFSEELTGDDIENYKKVDGRYEITPSHSTAFHPPYDFSHQNEVTRIRFNGQSSELFSSVSIDGSFTLYDIESMRPTFKCDLESSAYTLASSPGELGPYTSLFAAGIKSGQTPLLDPRTPLPVMRFTGSQTPIISLSWHPKKANILLCGGADSTIKLWDIRGGPGKTLNYFTSKEIDNVADIGATVGLCTSVDGEFIFSHHHRHIPANQMEKSSNKFILKVWDFKTRELLEEVAIPTSAHEPPPLHASKPSRLEPIFYTRQRRRPKVSPEPDVVTPAKRKRPLLPQQTFLNHNVQAYTKLCMRNLDPELGVECLSDAHDQYLNLPYAIIPPHPFIGTGEHSWLMYGFQRNASPKAIAISAPFLKSTCCALSPLDNEVYVGTQGGALMRVGDPSRYSVHPFESCPKEPLEGDSKSITDEDNWSE
ncbi:hypothetical protein DSO57_1013950 [Entomophthora muscae]|uniref:Uncharacterized protein n=1 Tax=Entomophthora muscae TaxID=34485 RepID=A0ACC2RKC9_9FUNG|nr:hypothetical protein DSO57_1013950 [Entomophthora muscae]